MPVDTPCYIILDLEKNGIISFENSRRLFLIIATNAWAPWSLRLAGFKASRLHREDHWFESNSDYKRDCY